MKRGGSPVLGIACPQCKAAPLEYCTKWTVMEPGAEAKKVVQIIAHKARRDSYWRPAR